MEVTFKFFRYAYASLTKGLLSYDFFSKMCDRLGYKCETIAVAREQIDFLFAEMPLNDTCKMFLLSSQKRICAFHCSLREFSFRDKFKEI